MSDANKVSYQTNFTGIKYNNNPLAVDANSFSNANNVYLNKYGALISRPPLVGQTYPWQVYGDEALPIELKVVGLYNLSNDGVVYVIYNSTTARYKLRYKSPAGVYSEILAGTTIASYDDFNIVQYKQFYIVFSVDGARVLNTTSPTNSWELLQNNVDVPVTVIQTGNEVVAISGNQLTDSYKKQYILKVDSDDTIYALPIGETAVITFPNQTAVTYSLDDANEYTRDRLIRKLAIPSFNGEALISMVGEKIAVSYSDRVDISLDYGETFETILYPTTFGYLNTASLSDDGQCFFYVHKNGVYRYMLGTREWTLIEVVLEPPYELEPPAYTAYTVEKELYGIVNGAHIQGANYCHFVNAEKFTFMLAHRVLISGSFKWITVIYTKGLKVTNLFYNTIDTLDGLSTPGYDLLNCYAYKSDDSPIYEIGSDISTWIASPYLNKRLVKILDDNTAVYYSKTSSTTYSAIIIKSVLTHVYLTGDYSTTLRIHYAAVKAQTFTVDSAFELNEVKSDATDEVQILVKETNVASGTRWEKHIYLLTYTDNVTLYTVTFTITEGVATFLNGIVGTSSILYPLSSGKYLTGGGSLIIYDSSLDATYSLSNITEIIKAVTSGNNYIVYDSVTDSWFTNIPLQTVLTYSYLDTDEFTQVPTAVFSDQNLWLAMNKTLWIGNIVNNKLSILPINNNVFSKQITGIIPMSATSKAIFFVDSITLCEEASLSDGSVVWHYYPLKFSVGIRRGDSVITTNDGKAVVFPTKYGLAILTYQLDIAATDQAITYLTDDGFKTAWTDFYEASTRIKIIHHNTQLILSNGTNQVLIYDLRNNGWYPLSFPTGVNISLITPTKDNYEILDLQPTDATLTTLTAIYQISKEKDELYSYATPYKDLGTTVIPWHITSQLLLLDAPNNYKNITHLIIDQVDSNELKQSSYLTTQIFRQTGNVVKPAIELVYNIDTFAKIVRKVNWWKVLGFKWQLNNDASSSYPTQLRLYNFSIKYEISYEVK